MLEQERQRIEQLTAGWDDPTQVNWGPPDDEEPAALPPEPTGPVYKCIALYSYTVSISTYPALLPTMINIVNLLTPGVAV